MSTNTPVQKPENNALAFEYLHHSDSLLDILKLLEEGIRYRLNCVRVGIISEYDPETRTAKVNLVNKLTLSQNKEGGQQTQQYAPLYCKVWFFGWKEIGITHPVREGQECIVLISDRELESWYIQGGINSLAYNRSHHLSDGIAVVGLTSLPEMTSTMQDCLHLFYNLTDVQIREDEIIINAETVINGNLTINGNLQVNGNISTTGTVTADTDVIAAGISLVKHIHPYTWTDGGGNGSTSPAE